MKEPVRKISPKALKMLRSIADQPWGINKRGNIRILMGPENPSPSPLQVCPVCFLADRKLGKWAYAGAYLAARQHIDMSIEDADAIACAADFPMDPNRSALIRALGGIRKNRHGIRVKKAPLQPVA